MHATNLICTVASQHGGPQLLLVGMTLLDYMSNIHIGIFAC